MIVLIRWKYENKIYEETGSFNSLEEAEEKFPKMNAGKFISAKKTKRKLGYYREFRDC